MVIACETCQDFWQLSWEPNYQLQRETGKTCCQRAAGQREWGTVSWPHHQPPSCFTRARHMNTTGITHVCYLEQRGRVKPQLCVSWVFGNHINWTVAFDLTVQTLPVFSVPRIISNHASLSSWNLHRLQPILLLSWTEEELWSFVPEKLRDRW